MLILLSQVMTKCTRFIIIDNILYQWQLSSFVVKCIKFSVTQAVIVPVHVKSSSLSYSMTSYGYVSYVITDAYITNMHNAVNNLLCMLHVCIMEFSMLKFVNKLFCYIMHIL